MTDYFLDSEPPFNEEFCTHLEYHLCRTFQKSTRPDLKYFWCDGILWTPTPDSQLTKKSVNDKRTIKTKAWLGTDGQEEYEMKILFGPSSLKRYAKGLSLIACIPSEETMDWINIDIEERAVVMQLK